MSGEKGSVIIPMLIASAVLSTLIGCLYLMSHMEMELLNEAHGMERLRRAGESCLEMEIEKLQRDEVLQQKIKSSSHDVLLDEFVVEEARCSIYGKRVADDIALMAAAGDNRYKTRLYVRLRKKENKYVPELWEY